MTHRRTTGLRLQWRELPFSGGRVLLWLWVLRSARAA